MDTNTAIAIDKGRQKEAKGEKLTPTERRVFEEFKGKDVWVPHAADTEVSAGGGTKESFKVATDLTSSTKEREGRNLERSAIGKRRRWR